MRMRLLIALLAIAGGETVAQPRLPAEYERVLLPFAVSMSNSAGTWHVQWWARNEGAEPADLFPLAAPCGLPPPPTPDGPAAFIYRRPALPARTTLTCLAGDVLPSIPVPPIVPIVSSAPGAFLYVEKAHAGSVRLGGVVRWLSSEGQTAPAAMEAIPESSFLQGVGSVMPLPVVPDYRYAVRIYALPESLTSPNVVIRVFEMQPAFVSSLQERLLFETAVHPAVPSSRVRPCIDSCDLPDVGFVPAVAQLFNVPTGNNGAAASTLRIEIAPESPDVKWWAVVSATHNSSQEIRLYQPPVIRNRPDA